MTAKKTSTLFLTPGVYKKTLASQLRFETSPYRQAHAISLGKGRTTLSEHSQRHLRTVLAPLRHPTRTQR